MALNRDEILLLFDVDNTLTKPRDVIDKDFENWFYQTIKPLATIGIVTGADVDKMLQQLNGKKVLQEFDYIFPENGIVHIEKGVEVQKSSFNEKLGEESLKRFINFVLKYIADLDLPYKRGTFIEYRNGMMNISPGGRQCSKEERIIFNEFDKIHQIRAKMIKVLEKEFHDVDLTYAVGGMISFDVFPKGWDKSFCLSRLPVNKFKEIHFFGDQTSAGGNDYEIYSHPSTIGHHVNNYQDTRRILSEMFRL
ncbi:CLUMA_CG014927, isoform A [Clunio marinus]|uniref:Phosphomannomutase n=1 Tax=Clunio marinus TaxID=568069 RepID=A0A1J1INA2_9DIPT|nr:CLUMA_CG014927, isoform A [Clunio marinus]